MKQGVVLSVQAMAGVATLLATPVRAQDDAGANGLTSDIVVTATRQSQRLQDVPAAISALDSETIRQKGITGLQDLQAQIPGLKFGNVSDIGNISLRGVGTAIVSGAGEASVAVHRDGVFISQPGALTMVQGDIERIEVLRGPQSTLYGKNATAGVINFISPVPTDELSAGVSARIGNYDDRYLSGHIGGAVASGLNLRASAYVGDRDGYTKNVITGQDLQDSRTLSGRLSMQATPGEGWTSLVHVFYDRERYNGPVWHYFDSNAAQFPAQFYLTDPYKVKSGLNYAGMKSLVGGSVRNTFDLGSVELQALTGYTRYHNNADYDVLSVAPPLSTRQLAQRTTNTFSQELNLSGETGHLKWLVGAFGFVEKGKLASLSDFTAILGTPYFLAQNVDYKRRGVSGFTDLTYSASDRFRVFGGARILHEYMESELFQRQGPAQEFLTCSPATTGDQKKGDTTTTGRLGMQYDLAEQVNLYGQVSHGYKFGGFSTALCDNPYDQETVNAIEGGIKSVLLDRTLTLNLAAYYYDYKNLQLEQSTITGIRFINVPKAHVLGMDVEFAWTPVNGFRVDLAGSLLDAKYDELINSDPNLGVAVGTSLKGVHLNNAPSVSGTLGMEYELPLGTDASIKLRGEVFHTSKFNLREFDQPFTIQQGYTTGNAYLTFKFGRYQARGYVKNIANKAVIAGVYGYVGALGAFQPPRTYGVELSWKY